MTVTSFGLGTMGNALAGIDGGFNSLVASFQGMRDTLDDQLLVIDGAVAALESQAATLVSIGDAVVSLGDLIDAAKATILIPATGGLNMQLLAQDQTQASLGAQVANPGAYVAAKISGVQQALASIAAVPPLVQITGQLTAAGVIALQLQAKIAVIDAAISAALDPLSLEAQAQGAAVRAAAGAIEVVIDGIDASIDALQAAIASADAALAAAFLFQASLNTSGAYAFFYSGTLGNFGAEMDAAFAASGVGAGVLIKSPVMFVKSASASASAAMSALYRTA